tara:strand:+ start:1500 stop:2471 length:972 start_codon:yes stop_codon:yes gene_type:complete
MKILVTGADGFIGSHLVELLLKKKHKVFALSMYNSFSDFGWLNGLNNKNLKIISGDIRDQEFCFKISKKIDVIFNLAALVSIPYSYNSIESFLQTNILGTYNICLSAKKNKVKRLIQISTSEVYGTAQYVPINEKHPKVAQSPYSASKISSDAIAQSFFHSFGLDVVIARPFNTFGPRQSLRAVIPTIISQALSKKKIVLGNINSRRDFTYVLDTCEGLYSLINKRAKSGEVFNIGSKKHYSIKDVIKIIKKKVKNFPIIEIQKKRIRPKNSEVDLLSCDFRKINRATGFKPKIDFERGIELTIDWFDKNRHLYRDLHNKYNI